MSNRYVVLDQNNAYVTTIIWDGEQPINLSVMFNPEGVQVGPCMTVLESTWLANNPGAVEG